YTDEWRSVMVILLDSYVPLTRVVKSKKPLHVANLLEDRAYLDGHPLTVTAADAAGIRTFIAVPMLKDDEPAGVFAIYRKEVRPFTDKQIKLGAKFAPPHGSA